MASGIIKALVTGGGGFLGGAIVRKLLERGDTVRSFSRGDYPELEKIGVEQYRGDIADPDVVARACEGVDIVFHVAAKAGVWGHYDDYYRANTLGTENVIQACLSKGISTLVYTSSPSVIFDGTDMEGVDESAPYPEHYHANYPKTKALAEQKARAPKQIAALEDEEKEAEAALLEKQQMLESVQMSRRELEREVEDFEGRKAASKQKLIDVKSNKEYQATLKEIDDIEGLVREREDQIIERMESAEHLDKEIKEHKRLVVEAKERRESEGTQIEQEAEKADRLIAELEEEKKKLKPKIPADLLKKYQFLRANRAGVALAPVNKSTCQVCHMNLPPQMFIDLQKNENMMYCPNCQRIIYWTGHDAYRQSSQILGEQE